MQFLPDFVCTECSHEFESAALLLQHFATHVLPNSEINSNTGISHVSQINVQNSDYQLENDKSSDSGLEVEDLNPLKLCLVTIDDNQFNKEEVYDTDRCSLNIIAERKTVPKYQCSFCLKNFGWPTDLKRHILIHTGERPFKCDHCNSSFTRKFILQKHQKKMHLAEIKLKIPDLKPIGTIKGKRKSARSSSYQVI